MQVELKFFATFREAVGSKLADHTFDADSVTVGDVLATLEDEYEDLDGQLLDGGDIRPMLSILKNGREVEHLDGTETVLEDGDTLAVFPPVAGG